MPMCHSNEDLWQLRINSYEQPMWVASNNSCTSGLQPPAKHESDLRWLDELGPDTPTTFLAESAIRPQHITIRGF